MDPRAAPASRFRLSIRGLLALTAAVAVEFGAVLYANQWWLIVLTLFVSLGIVASIVVALLDRGPPRAFAIGFLAYMAVSLFALPRMYDVGRKTPAGLFFEWLYPRVAETAPQDPTLTLLRRWENSPERYRQQFFLPVGEQLWTLTFALASGYVAYMVYATRREK